MVEENEAVVRRLVEEVINRGQSALLAELIAADHVGHDPFGDHYGVEGARIVVAEYRTAFPDMLLTIEDLVAARDTVAWRFSLRGTHTGPFLGLRPTGRLVTAVGIVYGRLKEGRVVESWVSFDTLSLLRQTGAPGVGYSPAQAAA
jgi:predicted ester cyclase